MKVSMNMRKLTGALVLLAALGAGAVGATIVSGGGPAPLDAAENDVTVKVDGSGNARVAERTQFVYPHTAAQVIPQSDNTTSNFTIKACPAGTRSSTVRSRRAIR